MKKILIYFLFISIFSCGKKQITPIANVDHDIKGVIGLIEKDDSRKVRDHNNKILHSIFKDANPGDKIIIPKGEIHFSTDIFPLKIPSKITLMGHGIGKTLLVFHPSAQGKIKKGGVGLFSQYGQQIDISNFSLLNLGSDHSSTKTFANTISLLIEDSKDIVINNIHFEGGHNGVQLENTTTNYDVNRNLTIQNCTFSQQASAGLLMNRCSMSNIKDNSFQDSGSDGLKTAKICKWLTIENNISVNNTRDGFDFYDGCLECIIFKNKAIKNSLHGFDLKGNPNENGMFVFRDNIISDNIASENKNSGFSLQNVRKVILRSNISTKNIQNGYFFNNVQSCTFSALQASENLGHGYLLNYISRSTFTGCTAIDNGQSSTSNKYNGFHLKKNAGANTFNSCVSINGTNRNNLGSQEFGFYFEKGSVNNKINNCEFSTNNKGNAIGGDSKSQKIN